MTIALIRTVILYFVLVIGIRLMGKRQVGELEPAELVLALVLYCLFYLAIAALHKIRRQERPPESYPFAPFLAVGFFTAYII